MLSQHHEPMDSTDHQRNVMKLSVAMGNLTLVLKGDQDLITDGSRGLYLEINFLKDFFFFFFNFCDCYLKFQLLVFSDLVQY